MTTIGVDVGGTRTRVAAIDAAGRIVFQCASPTSDVCKGRDPLAGIIQQIKRLLAHPAVSQGGASVAAGPCAGRSVPEVPPTSSAATGGGRDTISATGGGRRTEAETELRESERECCDGVEAIGLALPATLDEKRCSVVRCVNVPALEGLAVADEVSRASGLVCTLMTDMEAATWAEYLRCGSRPGRFLHLRIGTGVGVGMVNNGRPQRFDAERTTHLPALVVEHGPDARLCRCGMRGCLETYCSGAALLEEIRTAGMGACVDDLRVAHDRGDETAVAIVASAADALAKALKNLTTSLYPDVVNVGGGMIERLPALIERACLNQTRWAVPTLRPTFEPARLGDEAGVIGAAFLASCRNVVEEVISPLEPAHRIVKRCYYGIAFGA